MAAASPRAWAALALGVVAGFLLLGALYLIAKGDPALGAVLAACAAAVFASLPAATRRR